MKLAASMCVAALWLCGTGPVQSNAVSTDQSDLWWNPNESGWGMQLVQQSDIIFATIFVYDANRAPTWYAGTLNASGNLTWTGDLYSSTGPGFSAVPFNPATVAARKVGTLTWNGQFVESGTVTYTVDGVSVTKAVVRQPLKADNLNGAFIGAYKVSTTGCTNSSFNNLQILGTEFVVAQTANSLNVIAITTSGFRCTFSGSYRQAGHFGGSDGTYSCTTGEAGTYQMLELNVQPYSITGRVLGRNNQGCTVAAALAGLRE